jgi:hypothetical protein
MSKQYCVIVQNWAYALKIHILLVHLITMESNLVLPYACHDITLRNLQDAGIFSPTHRVYPQPTSASPLIDPPPGS